MAKQITIKTRGWECVRCGHQWVPLREEPPRICPKCKSAYWDVPRRQAAES